MPSAFKMRRVTVLPDNFEDWVENSVNINESIKLFVSY